MFLTIAIQTYNNAGILDITLGGLADINCPKECDYEILVVDNNSSDNTREVTKKHSELLAPRLRSVFEPAQGLSHARNRALHTARGDIVCFIDDDVKVDPGWLVAVHSAFVKYSPTIVGGRSYIIYPDERPSWFPCHREDLFSCLDYGDKVLVNTDKELFGLNFSVLRKAAIRIGGFNTDLGRCGNSLAGGEESDLLKRIRYKGGVAVYEPKAIVGHIVPAKRLRKRWLLRRIYSGAVSTECLLISRGQIANLSELVMGTFRCCGSVIKSMIRGNLNGQQFFEKQYFAAYNLGRLAATTSHLIKQNNR